MLFVIYITTIIIAVVQCSNDSNSNNSSNLTIDDFYHHANEHIPERFTVVEFHWEGVRVPFTIVLWLLFAGICKILFHISDDVAHMLPDSALLIAVGILVGLLLRMLGVNLEEFTLDETVFFLYLLPPLMFEAGYFMPNRALFENFTSIWVFAIIGTLWNTMTIGLSLFGLGKLGFFTRNFGIFEILLFSAMISCVDPVAVTSVFENVGVTDFLFINVYGEALLNDGATVMLYKMFQTLNEIGVGQLHPRDYTLGIISFFTIVLGGVLIGVFYAFAVSFATKHTENVRVLNPVFIFVMPYMAYLTATMFGVSAIFAIVTCGIVMKQYVKQNILESTDVAVKYFAKMMAQGSKTLMFIFFGVTTVSSHHTWDTVFVVSTLVFCLLYRIVGVVVQCRILNRDLDDKKFTTVDQFVMSWGGMRGAIAFGLAESMPDEINAKRMFVTTCIVVILFTVFLQGITLRPLVSFLHLNVKEKRQKTLFDIVYSKYLDYMMAGIEDIAGQKGGYSVIDTFEKINSRFLNPLLVRNAKRRDFDATKIVRAYNAIALSEAMELMKDTIVLEEEPASPKHSIRTKEDYATALNQLQQQEQSTSAGIQLSPIPMTEANLNEYMKNEDNAEMLYRMFSHLIDKKLKQTPIIEARKSAVEDDIEDDCQRDLLQKRNSTAIMKTVRSQHNLRASVTAKSLEQAVDEQDR